MTILHLSDTHSKLRLLQNLPTADVDKSHAQTISYSCKSLSKTYLCALQKQVVRNNHKKLL
ncbi:MAG: hypothetical protein ACRC3G_05945 [Bacteroidales bacterium]